jgi:hypothetical protein
MSQPSSRLSWRTGVELATSSDNEVRMHVGASFHLPVRRR